MDKKIFFLLQLRDTQTEVYLLTLWWLLLIVEHRSTKANVAKFYDWLCVICSVEKYKCITIFRLKLIKIVILWVMYIIPFNFLSIIWFHTSSFYHPSTILHLSKHHRWGSYTRNVPYYSFYQILKWCINHRSSKSCLHCFLPVDCINELCSCMDAHNYRLLRYGLTRIGKVFLILRYLKMFVLVH